MISQKFKVYDPSDLTIKEYLVEPEHYTDPLWLNGRPTNGISNWGFSHLDLYPENRFFKKKQYFEYNIHKFPFKISKGNDRYGFMCERTGENKTIGRHYWFLEFDDHIWNRGKGRQFKTLPRAINFALSHYKEYLRNEMNKIEEYER